MTGVEAKTGHTCINNDGGTPSRTCDACEQEQQETRRRHKSIYIGAPACFALEMAIRPVCEAFGVHCCYVVGSALERQDWRDVDVRMILEDSAFMAEFPDADSPEHYEFHPRWHLLTVALSKWLSDQTGLPIDFQIQSMTVANKRHAKRRSAVGIVLRRKDPE